MLRPLFIADYAVSLLGPHSKFISCLSPPALSYRSWHDVKMIFILRCLTLNILSVSMLYLGQLISSGQNINALGCIRMVSLPNGSNISYFHSLPVNIHLHLFIFHSLELVLMSHFSLFLACTRHYQVFHLDRLGRRRGTITN